MKPRFPRHLVATILATVILGAGPASAQEQFTLYVDCTDQPSPSEGGGQPRVKNTETNDPVTVRFLDADRNALGSQFRMGVNGQQVPYREVHQFSNCAPRFWASLDVRPPQFASEIIVQVPFDRPVKFVTFSTDGGDAMWIDQIQLWRDGPGWVRAGYWGKDHGKGYCLSAEEKDADGSWKSYISPLGCRPCLEFQVDERKVASCGATASADGDEYFEE